MNLVAICFNVIKRDPKLYQTFTKLLPSEDQWVIKEKYAFYLLNQKKKSKKQVIKDFILLENYPHMDAIRLHLWDNLISKRMKNTSLEWVWKNKLFYLAKLIIKEKLLYHQGDIKMMPRYRELNVMLSENKVNYLMISNGYPIESTIKVAGYLGFFRIILYFYNASLNHFLPDLISEAPKVLEISQKAYLEGHPGETSKSFMSNLCSLI